MKSFLIYGLFSISSSAIVVAQAPLSADKILKGAQSEAAKDKKNVFVIFHAS